MPTATVIQVRRKANHDPTDATGGIPPR
jgi:hypothetical protein